MPFHEEGQGWIIALFYFFGMGYRGRVMAVAKSNFVTLSGAKSLFVGVATLGGAKGATQGEMLKSVLC